MSSFEDFVDSLMSEPVQTRPTKADKPKYPCGQCGGTGEYSGVRVHQEKAHCFACRGLGYFTTSPKDREKARRRNAEKAESAREAVRQRNEAAAPGMIDRLRQIADWSGLAASVVAEHDRGLLIREKTIHACLSMLDKIDRKREERAAAEREARTLVDLSTVRAMFDKAAQAQKEPRYRAEGLTLTLASAFSKNPGAIYVRSTSGEYYGKVVGTVFHPVRSADKTVGARLARIAENPAEAAVRYGRETGVCACCGRKLTDPKSVEAGIGPICAATFGF